ncbi:DUF3348 family protein [Parahaliea aestuarii]|uniref:DUF3348 domain-containing protein n=1 Tax=Parahaliea aestuarii TaxID=1852021 RepID=A0A5C8ZRI4_9GAMM|nr:DUF3348 family protein [Parahaliea aestuarii]TXS91098.1 DUF3348 domain-containing protein [Parahaliea aestuarii]
MSRTPTSSSFSQTRLISLLSSLGGPRGDADSRQFGQRLGGLIDLSHSVILADTLASLERQPFEPVDEDPARAREDFLRVRAAMMGAVIRSLVPDGGASRIRWPEAVLDAGGGDALRRFYSAHQREMDARVRGLQERCRDALRGCSAALMQLATLDQALMDALAGHSRRLFGNIPDVLEKMQVAAREMLLQGGADAEGQLKTDVQALLLAEIDARLLPALGLIEALDEHLECE